MTEVRYPKRLIEVDLPIKRISAHARREKSIRHGHISTLHIWWARRPLAACRAVICAALWPDPADPLCPPAFRDAAFKILNDLRANVNEGAVSAGTRDASPAVARMHFASRADAGEELRSSLLDFIAEFANWDLSTNQPFLEASRALTQAAHEALGGLPGTRPLVVDPFAGGGSIPLEALRVGADAFASDLNPIPVLLNKVVLEYIPKYGQRLADEVRKWGAWIKEEAEKELAEFYPKDPDGATPIAYLWARTIRCEGPGCGAEVPLMRSLWLAKKAKKAVALQLLPNPRQGRVDFRLIVKTNDGWVSQVDSGSKVESPKFDGTVRRGSAMCPCCGFTTQVARVREQLKLRKGGTNDALLLCVVTTKFGEQGRGYRLATDEDRKIANAAAERLRKKEVEHAEALSLIPDEKLDIRGIRHTWGMIYGLWHWRDWYTARQLLTLSTVSRLVELSRVQLSKSHIDELPVAIQTCLALALGRQADALSSAVTWATTGEFQRNTFARQALAFVWDFAEVNPLCNSGGGFSGAVEWIARVCESLIDQVACGTVQQASAVRQALPDDMAHLIMTDPPYYDAVPYSFLADYFYVWLRRVLWRTYPDIFSGSAVPKDAEIVVDRPHELSNSTHDIAFYEKELCRAFSESRRIARPDGLGTIVFASKTTASWEAILQAVVDAGWTITGSWPVDTEREARVSAQGQARLASSVHLVCRPRENPDGSLRTEHMGDWREVLTELPHRIHEWMPRLAAEGVVGADAIFACLGPALEIFSQYSRVEKASGEKVELREYLEQVWAAVAREALSTVLNDADASALEPDARLTVIWLWTLGAGADEAPSNSEDDEVTDDDEVPAGKSQGGFVLEYDAARKIAQGLGARLEELHHVVEVKGDQARLLPVSDRARYLFGKTESLASPPRRRAQSPQMSLFAEIEEAESARSWDEIGPPRGATTTLDRVHQSMLLFGTGRGEALKRFLVEEGIGRQAEFWKVAQSLSALYPAGTEEKRWVDGVLARKKGLGFG